LTQIVCLHTIPALPARQRPGGGNATKIDAFAHILPPAYAERLESITSGAGVSERILGYRPWIREDPALTDLDARWRTMSQLGALGAQLYTNVSGAPLDERRFGAIFDTVIRRDGVLWIHPTRSRIWADYPSEKRSEYGIWWSLGWPYETSACMVRLVYSGCFDRYPGLRLITHHAGAMVPHFSGRLASPLEDPDRAATYARLQDDPMDYFRRFYADTAMFGASHAVRCAVEFFGPGHMLFGTDMPLGGPTVVADTIADIEALGLPEADAEAIFAGNARRVLRIPA